MKKINKKVTNPVLNLKKKSIATRPDSVKPDGNPTEQWEIYSFALCAKKNKFNTFNTITTIELMKNCRIVNGRIERNEFYSKVYTKVVFHKFQFSSFSSIEQNTISTLLSMKRYFDKKNRKVRERKKRELLDDKLDESENLKCVVFFFQRSFRLLVWGTEKKWDNNDDF